ncbi:MAG: peptidase S8 and S53 subtilisin kexin sedolisin [Gammaproteobacteria bacterium]|nr:MAG: peptidase S8 and S53 subtilisin kexin sedolisin [Gammaproteobacteria bacterium]
MISVGIIDSGVPEPAPACLMEARGFRYEQGRVVERDNESGDRLGHGGMITRIIIAGSPEVALYSAQVFQEKLLTRPAQVAAAIDWLLERRVRIVNMSFGLGADRAILREACARAVKQGVVLVASVPARGSAVYPGAYPGVIRVSGDARCGPGEISSIDGDLCYFGAYADGDAGSGSSAAAARVSAAIAMILSAYPTAGDADVFNRLKNSAAYVGRERRIPKTPA